MANSTLSNAKAAKKDEFYTMFYDIETEMEAYLDYNPDVFRGKTVLLPCDDPEWSNFTRYFVQNFEELGLKKLISTSYAIESKAYKTLSSKRNLLSLTKAKAILMVRFPCWNTIRQAMGESILMIWNGTILKGMEISEVMR